MNSMILCVILAPPTQWIIWKSISTVLINAPDHGEGKENQILSRSQPSHRASYERAHDVLYEPFNHMAVQRTTGIGSIQPMMDRMDMFVKKHVHMKYPVAEIHPGIENEPDDRMSAHR